MFIWDYFQSIVCCFILKSEPKISKVKNKILILLYALRFEGSWFQSQVNSVYWGYRFPARSGSFAYWGSPFPSQGHYSAYWGSQFTSQSHSSAYWGSSSRLRVILLSIEVLSFRLRVILLPIEVPVPVSVSFFYLLRFSVPISG